MNSLTRFSKKQKQLLTWWCRESPYRDCQAVICDGAVRSGKTFCMGLSFACWAMSRFTGENFALCGKTVSALKRNLTDRLLEQLKSLGFGVEYRVSQSRFTLRCRGRENRFFLFGGKDESSASLIQGMTLAGVLLDEVALMPRSFVEQALARCSVEGSRFWFNCNPEGPSHWFFREWVSQAQKKHALHLHFTMEDNPSLSPAMRQRYRELYQGVFYRRFVLGEWAAAQGLVYPMFEMSRHVFTDAPGVAGRYVSCDYGTINPMSMGLWGQQDGVWYRLKEYYYDSRRENRQLTDQEYLAALEQLIGAHPVEAVIIDPSAASFLECVRRTGRWKVLKAKNQVQDGIRRVSTMLGQGRLKFHVSCTDTIREFSQYVWEDSGQGEAPKKEHDHAMDDIRYLVSTLADRGEGAFFVASNPRPAPQEGGGFFAKTNKGT